MTRDAPLAHALRHKEAPMSLPRTGFCACGCGQRTTISKMTDSRYGSVRGEPAYWIMGHNGRVDVVQRFMRRVSVPTQASGCWEWTGYIDRAGYGLAYGRGRTERAHRLAYELFVAPIPKGMHLDHLCRCPICVNPLHLEVVSARVNTHRGIGPSAANAQKTHCVHGHEFTPENTAIERNRTTVQRVCKKCRSRRERARRVRLREAA